MNFNGSRTQPIVLSEPLADFISSCADVIETAMGGPEVPVPALDGEVELAQELVKAYLLFLACEAPRPADVAPASVSFHERVDADVWCALGFAEPPCLSCEFGVALIVCTDPTFLPAEICGLVKRVQASAAAGLFRDWPR